MLKQGKEQRTFEDIWPELRCTVLKLLKQEAVSHVEWQDLFYGVHLVCLWDEKGPSKIYDCLINDIVEFIGHAQKKIQNQRGERELLKSYIVEWRRFFTQSSYLPLPFRQLEITLQGRHIPTNNSTINKKSYNDESVVRKIMLDSWNNNIFVDIKDHLQESAMKIVQAERNGEAYDCQLVIGVRESYVNLCSNAEDRLEIYREHFEAAYFKATSSFYSIKSSYQQQTNGVQSFLKYADSKIREEEIRAKRYLESSSFHALSQCCIKVLIGDNLNIILAECPSLIKAYEIQKLNLMFRLLDRVPNGVEPMLRDLENHIVNAGITDILSVSDLIIQDSEKYVDRLLELFRKFSSLVEVAFNKDPRFLTSRDKAFKTVINDIRIFKLELPANLCNRGIKHTAPESKCPELLANYCDMLLRRTPLSKRLTSEQIDRRLKDVLLVLKYVNNKDVFMRYHKVHLTRRLILGTSADSEKEEDIVEWLREVGMPADYVNKLARMFQDIKVSEDINTLFRMATIRHEAVNIKILNAGAWARCSDRVSVSLPLELEDYIPEVEEFYKQKHSGRKLQWYHHMSNGTITFVNKIGKYDLDVTTFQLAVLFAWNHRPSDKISYENLRLATELTDPELRKTLWSLVAFPKIKKQILLMDPVAISYKHFTQNTLFYINQEFSVIKNGKQQRRGKMNLIGRLQLSTERSQQEDNQSIVQLRILRTQEAIIKIMKMRKRIQNASLQAELINILKNMFLPSKKMIKEQLEWLIEHKYMRRDDNDINTFIYMA